jgi:hypothetical protein
MIDLKFQDIVVMLTLGLGQMLMHDKENGMRMRPRHIMAHKNSHWGSGKCVKVQRKNFQNSPKHPHFGIHGLSIERFFKKSYLGCHYHGKLKKL